MTVIYSGYDTHIANNSTQNRSHWNQTWFIFNQYLNLTDYVAIGLYSFESRRVICIMALLNLKWPLALQVPVPYIYVALKTLRPRQNGRHFGRRDFQMHFL